MRASSCATRSNDDGARLCASALWIESDATTSMSQAMASVSDATRPASDATCSASNATGFVNSATPLGGDATRYRLPASQSSR